MKYLKNILIGASLLLITILAFMSKRDKTISSTEWNCGGGLCEIRMVIVNLNNYKVQNRIVIRAHNQEKYDRDPGAKGNKVVGEKHLDVIMEANEEKEIVEQLELNYPAKVHMLVAKSIKTERI